MNRHSLIRSSLIAAALSAAGLSAAATVGDQPAYPGTAEFRAAPNQAQAPAPRQAHDKTFVVGRASGIAGDYSAYPGATPEADRGSVASLPGASPIGPSTAAGAAAGAFGSPGTERATTSGPLYVH